MHQKIKVLVQQSANRFHEKSLVFLLHNNQSWINKKSPQYSTIVKKPIKADIAINGADLSNILKLEDRVKKIKATKFAISDHKVKNRNCFPNPVSKKTLDPEKKKISSTKKGLKINK